MAWDKMLRLFQAKIWQYYSITSHLLTQVLYTFVVAEQR